MNRAASAEARRSATIPLPSLLTAKTALSPRHRPHKRDGHAAALVAAIALAGCDKSTGPETGEPGIEITVGREVSDTIQSLAALRVRVRDESGRPSVGRVVRFEAVPLAGTSGDLFDDYRAFIAGEPPQTTATFRADTTDDRGEAEVPIRIGSRSGTGYVRIHVPALGYADSARYDVAPGAAVGATVEPADSAVFVGNGYRMRAHAVDRLGNQRTDPVTFTVAYGPVTVDAGSARVTGQSLGRAAVIVQAQGKPDTAYVSVVPEAQVAAQEFFTGNGGPKGIFVMQLDGSGRQPLAPGIDNVFIPQGFGWSPDGRELVVARGTFINLVTPGAAERPLVEMSGPVMTSARFSRDGLWVYFAHAGTARQAGGIYRVRTDGTGLEHLGAFGNDILPSPSRDGRLVSYTSYRSPCNPCIRVIDVATKQDISVFGRDYISMGLAAAWSPVEDLLALHDGTRIVLFRPDGTVQRVLVDRLPRVLWMDWSPDGHWIVASGDAGILLVDAATGAQLPLGHFNSYRPVAWRP